MHHLPDLSPLTMKNMPQKVKAGILLHISGYQRPAPALHGPTDRTDFPLGDVQSRFTPKHNASTQVRGTESDPLTITLYLVLSFGVRITGMYSLL